MNSTCIFITGSEFLTLKFDYMCFKELNIVYINHRTY